MTNDTLPEYVRGLLDPSAYPAPPDRVDLVQTHISYVFLAGGVVYKTKKPVDFGFIEQMSVERRRAFCEAEVRLNARLAPDVYMAVVPVVRTQDGQYHVEPRPVAGMQQIEVVEWAVKMRRLPDDRTLDRLLAAGELAPGVLERIVRRLVAFHEHAEVLGADRADFAGSAAVAAWWTREYGEATVDIGGTWREDEAAATNAFFTQTIETQQALLNERLAEGRVVEGHGDLQAKHVYVLDDTGEHLAIVDCIEFSDWFQFRYLDAGYDVAFLAMDLEAQGHADLGDELAGRYIAAAHDETMGVLQPMHRGFRAFVRGKVESIGARAGELPTEQRAHLADSASRYYRLAADYARRQAAPALVVLCGLPGTGKSTVGATLAGRIGAAYLSSDTVRKQLAGIDPRERVTERDREGLYAPGMNERTYDELRRRAAEHLAAGRPVVLDAMHGRAEERRAALAVAQAAGVPALIAELRLSESDALTRIDARASDPNLTSDATREVYLASVGRFEEVGSSEGTHLGLDASQGPAELAREIASALGSLSA